MRIAGVGRRTILTDMANSMKRRIFCFIITAVIVCLLCACGEQNVTTQPTGSDATQKTTATTTTTTKLTMPVTEVTANGYAYRIEGNGVVITGYMGSETNIEIPQSIRGKQVVEIGFEAFRNSEIKSVKIPFGVKRIGAFAFFNAPIESIEIPETVIFIGNNALSFTNLTEFETPMGISTISAELFIFCQNLESVIITDNVTQIDYGAFAYCPSLEAVYVPDSVDYIADDAFEGWFDGFVLYGEEDSYAQQYAEDKGIEFEIV